MDPVGHTGTLDPAATGLLVVCTGYATRLVPWLQAGEKAYVVRIRFGSETDTCDAEGEVIGRAEPPGDLAAALPDVLPRFTGAVRQVPPRYSAIRINGRRAHDLAREGAIADDEIPPREIYIHALDVQRVEGTEAWLEVTCSPGTYIRTLAVDLGRALDSAAHLAALRRVRTGGFDVSDAVPLDALLALDEPGEHWRPIPDALRWARRIVDEDELVRVLNGGSVAAEDVIESGPVILVDASGNAVAVGEREDDRVVVRRLLTSGV